MTNAANSIDIHNILQDPHSLAKEISNKWTQWKMGRNTWEARVKETVNFVYATSTQDTTNSSNNHSHSTHIPMLTMIKDNLDSNYLMSAMPNDKWFEFVGEDRESSLKVKRDAVESYLRTKHRLTKFRNTTAKLISDWTLYGNCFASVDYVRESNIDPSTGELTLGYVGPRINRISPYDIVFNVMATSFKESPKIIRSLKTLGELARDAEERPELGYSSEVLQQVTELRSKLNQIDPADFDKIGQLQFDGFNTPMEIGRAHV